MSHYRPRDGKDGIPGTHGKDGRDGEQGPIGPAPEHDWVGTNLRFQNPDGTWGEFVDLEGPKGEQGEPGRDGVNGKDGLNGTNGKDGARGPAGRDGVDGQDGATGPMPDHEWRGTALRFEEPDGTWGPFVNLKGEKGDQGYPGGNGPPGPPGPEGPPGPSGSGNVIAGDGIEVEQVGDDVVVSHGDTSSVIDLSTSFSGGFVIQNIALTFDQFGHVLTADADGVDFDSRYIELGDSAAIIAALGYTPASAGSIGSSGLTMSTGRLLGRTTAGTGAPEEITVGAGLSLSGGTLASTNNFSTGLYSARPSASGNSGLIYYATDVRETYRSNGTAWSVIGGAGNELGYAERSSTFTTTSLTLVDVPGMSITFTAGERPVSINYGATLRNQLSGEFTRLALVLDGSPVGQLLTQSTLYYGLSRQFRPSAFTPGTSHVAKLQVLTTAAFGAGTAEVFGDPTDRPYIQVVNC